MQYHKFQFIFIVLFICTARVRPWEELPESGNDMGDPANHPEKVVNEETEYRYSCKRNEECNIKSSASEKADDNEIQSCTLSDCQDKGCDESELRMLEEDVSSPAEKEVTAEEHCQKPIQASVKGCQDESVKTDLKAECGHTSSDLSEIQEAHDTQVSGEHDCACRKNLETEKSGVDKEMDETPGDENAEQLPETEEGDPELENVPLREILLKLKPEGLTDDEDDQTSDYSATEASTGDVEVEEALVSSGSAEKQEEDPDVNGTKSSSASSSGSKKAVCLEVNITQSITDVEITNATNLMRLLQVDPNVTGRTTAGPCHLVYFFSPYCPFSVAGSPYVNALARSLPNIPVFGLDSIEHHSVNARYGVMGTPTLLLFHNGNGVGRYNASEYSVSQLMAFVRHYTDQEITNINVTSLDFRAKLPSQVGEARPYTLWAAWVFLLSLAAWLFLTSELCARLTEAVLNNWREAEAQNDHQD